jgi:hypothetical protein
MNSTMSEEAINKRNEMFREVHPAEPATHEKTFVTVDESVYNGAFTATQGKTLADVQRENEQTVNDLFKPQDEIGSVFETREKKLEEKISNERNDFKPTSNNGIDSKGLESIRQESSTQDKTIQQSSVGSNLGL